MLNLLAVPKVLITFGLLITEITRITFTSNVVRISQAKYSPSTRLRLMDKSMTCEAISRKCRFLEASSSMLHLAVSCGGEGRVAESRCRHFRGIRDDDLEALNAYACMQVHMLDTCGLCVCVQIFMYLVYTYFLDKEVHNRR